MVEAVPDVARTSPRSSGMHADGEVLWGQVTMAGAAETQIFFFPVIFPVLRENGERG